MVGQPIAAQVREGQAVSQNSLLHLRIKAHKNKGIPAPGILNVTRWKYIKMDILALFGLGADSISKMESL